MALQERLNGGGEHRRPARARNRGSAVGRADRPLDRFADLRSSLHDACIAKVGPELIGSETNDGLAAHPRPRGRLG